MLDWHTANPAKKNQLAEVKDEATGLPLLRLPEGFRYRSYGWSGDKMDDGTRTPSYHDGMGVIAAGADTVTLARNHEVSSDGPCLPTTDNRSYDDRAQGGCTNLVFDTSKGTWTSSWVSMSGSSRNCAGGVTPWGLG